MGVTGNCEREVGEQHVQIIFYLKKKGNKLLTGESSWEASSIIWSRSDEDLGNCSRNEKYQKKKNSRVKSVVEVTNFNDLFGLG